MYLKSLELVGFKSFGRKTVFEFQPGITAIIGPNGSGKSNVCDAIRWVLGEQSAKALRGNKMAEVIFAGTPELRPAAFAQVKLLIDNEDRAMAVDYSEVSLGRQLFRSGESNYFLNNTRSLLNELKEMLMDTGIGKDGYSIIGQGDISDIISQRISSRRSLIEEAAGITKFKHRKANTLQKLDHTRANITRLTDIISEIEGTLAPLAEQAAKTRKYQALSQEIRTLEVDLILFDLARYYSEFDNHDSMRRGLLAKVAEIQAFLQEIDGRKTEVRDRISGLEEKVKSEQARMRDHQQVLEEIRNLIGARKEDVRSFQARRQAIQEEMASIDQNLMATAEERQDAENRLREEETQEITIQGRMAEVETNLKKVEGEFEAHLKEVSQDRDSSFHVASLMSDKRNTIHVSGQQVVMLQRQLEKSAGDAESLHTQLGKLQNEKERVETEIVTMEKEISAAEAALNEERQKLGRCEKDLSRSEEELTATDDQIKIHQARRNLLEELKNRSEAGTPRGVREALAMKERELPGIFGVVGELLTVPRGYETAFETALGGSIQDVVTRDAETAQKAITALKDRKAGRATFLPIDMIQPPPRLEKPQARGCQGVALDLVEYDAKFYSIMNHLMGRILIFDTLDNAVAYSRQSRNFSRIVTIEGDVVRSSGAMTGGSEGQKGMGMLSRKREMEDLEEKLKTFQGREKKLMAMIGNLKQERTQLTQKVRQQEDFIARRKQSLDFFRHSLVKVKGDLETKAGEVNHIDSDRGELQTECDKQARNAAEAQTELSGLEEQHRGLTARLNSFSGREEGIQARLNSLRSMMNEERMVMVAIIERKKGCKKEIDAAEKRRQSASERKDRASSEVTQLTLSVNEAEAQIADKQKRFQELDEQRREFEQSLEAVQDEYRKGSRELENLDHTYQSRAKIEDTTKNKLSELEVKIAEVKTHIQNKESILTGEFGYQMGEPGQGSSRRYDNREQILLHLTERKATREALEPVNPLAIDDYEKSKERFDFLSSQVKDLTEAANSLEQVITEIEKISIERFRETYNKINLVFADLFKILFPGGNSQLRLTEPERPLESNVDIVCQLPGKKQMSLELCSGGEQAMISIALLFSILQVKPPAFCLLDEVEAALDEANVRRFTRLLRSFADKTQFLIITHNKETMQAVDVIYGVTLEKTGISRPISIRLEDHDKIREFTVTKRHPSAAPQAMAVHS